MTNNLMNAEIDNIKKMSVSTFENLLKNAHNNPKIFSLNIQDLNLGNKEVQDYFKNWMKGLLR